MIQNLTSYSGMKYTKTMWRRPNYMPEHYELYYMCKLQDTDRFYINSKRSHLSSATTIVRLSGLLAESVCYITLFAIYNPASVDPGLTIITQTLGSTKTARKCGLLNLENFDCLSLRTHYSYTCTCISICICMTIMYI